MALLTELMKAGHLTRAQALWAEEQARTSGRPVEDVLLLHGLATLEALRTQGINPDATAEELRVIQARVAKMLQAVFELCVQAGWLTHEEFLERLSQTSALTGPDPES